MHASCVALGGKGILILGASGAGKTTLSLELMAFGAQLVADDQTILALQSGALLARCPPQTKGLIEVRQIGILRADTVENAIIHLIVDLDRDEPHRLPPKRVMEIFGQPIELVFGANCRHLAFGVLQYIRAGRFA